MPRWLARMLGRTPLPETPRIRHHDGLVSLQFVRSQTQSRMRRDDPDHLLIDYTRTMFATLLWQPAPVMLGMVGLGGGSQTKFAYRHLPTTRIEVVENNPQVVVLRGEFGIPEDDARLSVVIEDGARFVADRPGRFDVLLVDGYDARGIPPALSTQAFYDACREALGADGVLACNLFVRDPQRHVERLQRAFGQDRVLVIDEPKMSNRVAFAWRGELPALDADALVARVPLAVRSLLPEVFPRMAVRMVRQRTVTARD